jgi:Abnormal spindle-like microcephaly-assoc'd, ASPM-SPD-2-Hydin
MGLRSLALSRSDSDNCAMRRDVKCRYRYAGVLVATLAALALVGCVGVSSSSKSQPTAAGPGQLAVSPATMNFGNVAVGSSSNQTGSLTAGSSSVAVSSAGWNGQGYSLSGITFPVTVPAGQSVPFTVTFAPPAAGVSSGSISFVSNASNSPTAETLTGAGMAPGTHSVTLSWNPSTSPAVGYNVYRGTSSGGPYSKLNSAPQPGASFTDLSVLSGATYFYVATAVDSNSVESAHSNEAKAVIPTP